MVYWIDVITREKIKSNPSESRRAWLLRMFENTASKANNVHQRTFWQPQDKPIELWRQDIIEQKLNNIHQNPVKSGYVNEQEPWWYSSALKYAD